MSASRPLPHIWSYLFFFNDTATTEIYTLTLHDALPISETDRVIRHDDRRHPTEAPECGFGSVPPGKVCVPVLALERDADVQRSEEHTSELQSPCNLVCRLLLEKKKRTVPPDPVTSLQRQ